MSKRGWQVWKKWVTLAVAAGMVISQTAVAPVQAAEQQEGGKEVETTEYAEDELYMEGIVSVSGGNEEEPGATDGAEESKGMDSGTVEGTSGINAAEEVDVATKGILHRGEMPAEDHMDIQTEALEADYVAGNIASGQDGNITWVIDAGGKLTVEGTGELSRGENVWDLAWRPYKDQITSAKISVGGMTNASGLFCGCENLTSVDVSDFDTSSVRDMSYMFAGCESLTSVDVSSFDTSNVDNMEGMFELCRSLKSLDLSSFNSNWGVNMDFMFYACSSLERVDLWYFNGMNRMESMFAGCSNLTNVDMSRGYGKVFTMYSMFSDCSSLKSVDLSGIGIDSDNCTHDSVISGVFQGCVNLNTVKPLDEMGNHVIDLPASFLVFIDAQGYETQVLNDFFCRNNTLTRIETSVTDYIARGWYGDIMWIIDANGKLTVEGSGDLSASHLDHVDEDFAWRPYCEYITSAEINVSGMKDAFYLFHGCSNMISINLSGFDTSSVTDMSCMFSGCGSLKSVDVSGFDTGNVRDMSSMFAYCSSLESVDVSSFDTRNVMYMREMFDCCESLKSVDVSGFDTSNVTDMSDMFSNCPKLNSIKTPYKMGTETIALPATFTDAKGAETRVLSKDFCNTTLTGKLPKPTPAKFTVAGVIGGRNVTFNTDTKDAVIYYSAKTSNLTTADACVKPGETVLFENFYGTIYARTYANGQWSNVSRLVLKIPVVSKPTITSKDGVVTIRTTTPDSYIYYTTDGSIPSPTNGKKLVKSGGSFTVPANCTVKAIAVRSCFTNSEVVSASVAAKKLGAPSFVVKGVIGGREVTFNTTETKGEIYYSFTTSNITTKDRHVKPGEKVLFQNYYGTVYARTYVNGQWSNVSRLVLKIPVVNKPTITAAGAGKVKISTSTPSCTIYYTTDGSTPSPTNGTRINSSSSIVTVGSGKTVKAIAVRSCFTNSEVTTYRQK